MINWMPLNVVSYCELVLIKCSWARTIECCCFKYGILGSRIKMFNSIVINDSSLRIVIERCPEKSNPHRTFVMKPQRIVRNTCHLIFPDFCFQKLTKGASIGPACERETGDWASVLPCYMSRGMWPRWGRDTTCYSALSDVLSRQAWQAHI